MRQEITRLKNAGLGNKTIATVLHISKNTVKKYIEENDQEDKPKDKSYSPVWASFVDWNMVSHELEKGMALSAWWEEHIKIQSMGELAGVSYISFWREFRRRYPKLDLEFHKNHPPGERCEADFKGDDHVLGYIDRATGEYVSCRLFGAVLCYSQMFCAVARPGEKQTDWLSGLQRSFEYFGGVTRLVCVDNAKAAVVRADWWDPDINPEFFRFCTHYGVAPVAARPRRPKDKNLIEGALGLFWRWAHLRITSRNFFSLGELNAYLEELSSEFNNRVQRKYGRSRRARYEEQERSQMLPLPQSDFELAQWKKAKVHPDCHVQVQKNFFSVPYTLRGQVVDVRLTSSFVEIFQRLERVAVHPLPRSNQQGRYITQSEHLPKAHQAMLEVTPQRLIQDAGAVGPKTQSIVQELIQGSMHPLMYLRRCQGILRLKTRYTAADLERVSSFLEERGQRKPRLADFENLLKNPRYLQLVKPAQDSCRQPNEHLRGQKHWQMDETPREGAHTA